jgi:hypothetical protein
MLYIGSDDTFSLHTHQLQIGSAVLTSSLIADCAATSTGDLYSGTRGTSIARIVLGAERPKISERSAPCRRA